MTNETKILTALLDPNHTDHYLMHTTVGRNITIRHNGRDNAIIIEHGNKRIMVAMGKEDSFDGLIPFMEAKKGVREFDTYREPLTPTKGGEDGKGIPSVFNFKIMERQSPMVLRPVDTIRYRMFDHDDIVIPEIRDNKAEIFSALDPVFGQPVFHKPHTTVADHPFMSPSDAKIFKLSQYINKEHMESHTGQTITDEAWEVFVNRTQDGFAEEVSQLAFEFWNDYDPMDWEEEE